MDIVIEGCSTTGMSGPYCNRPINMISCSQSSINKHSRILLDSNDVVHVGEYREANYFLSSSKWMNAEHKQVDTNDTMFVPADNFLMCNNSLESSCLRDGEWSIYVMDIVSITSQFVISLTDLKFNQTPPTENTDFGRILVMSYVRYNVVPLESLHDYSADISSGPLIIKSPKIGRWFLGFRAVNQTKVSGAVQETLLDGSLCFSFMWLVPECNSGKAGFNCTWEAHALRVGLW